MSISLRFAAVTVTVLLVAGTTTAPVFGQEPEVPGVEGPGEEGRAFFQAGYIGLDLDDLNGRLADAGLPGVDGTVLTLGGAGYGNRGNMMFGLEGHGLLGGDETTANGSTQVALSGGYGLFRFGYRVYAQGDFEVYPLLGIGGGKMNLKLLERSAPVFDDVLEDPERSSTLSASMFLLDFGVGLDYRFVIEDEEGGPGGIALGIHAGYTLAPGSTSWKLDGINSVAGGPKGQIEGFYVRASIGFWGRDDGGEG
jgi:hypothetical protein